MRRLTGLVSPVMKRRGSSGVSTKAEPARLAGQACHDEKPGHTPISLGSGAGVFVVEGGRVGSSDQRRQDGSSSWLS